MATPAHGAGRPAGSPVPDAVQQAGNQAVAALWQAAQALANESLQAAQAGWDRERNELEAVRGELADAFEAQARELEEAQARVTLLEQQAAEAAELAARQRQALAEARTALAGAEQRAALATQRADEVERRAQELRAELDYAHQTPAHSKKRAARPWTRPTRNAGASRRARRHQARSGEFAHGVGSGESEGAGRRRGPPEQRKLAAQEAARQAERFTTVQAERDEARQEAKAAQEEAAMLRGRLDAETSGRKHKAGGK